MRRGMVFAIGAALLLVISWGTGAWAAQRLITGDIWVTMSQDQKVAYIWGAGDVVDIEQELVARYPELKQEDFSAKVVEGMADISKNDIIAKVDAWYRANPDSIKHSVLRVIWDLMIKPNIKTGIAGRPLQ